MQSRSSLVALLDYTHAVQISKPGAYQGAVVIGKGGGVLSRCGLRRADIVCYNALVAQTVTMSRWLLSSSQLGYTISVDARRMMTVVEVLLFPLQPRNNEHTIEYSCVDDTALSMT